MRVVALGGCGQEGRTTVRTLLEDTGLTSLLIADIDEVRARHFAEELADPRVAVLQLDVTNGSALLAALSGADVVANFVGPYYLFGPLVLDAAIEAGVDYVDINDDTDATAACFERNEAARNAGISAVIGLGASPGLSNILARSLADQLATVHRIDIRWQVSITDVDQSAGASAALLHFLHAIDGDVPQVVDGVLRGVPAWSGEERVDFKSIGPRQAYVTAHPEPWTLHHSMPHVRDISCKGGVAGLDDVVPLLRALGLTSDEALLIDGYHVNPRRVALALLERMPAPDPAPPPLSGLKVSAEGMSEWRETRLWAEVMAPSRMTLLTGIPTAVGIKMLAEGRDRKIGVLPPEQAFDPEAFLQLLDTAGVTIHTGREG